MGKLFSNNNNTTTKCNNFLNLLVFVPAQTIHISHFFGLTN